MPQKTAQQKPKSYRQLNNFLHRFLGQFVGRFNVPQAYKQGEWLRPKYIGECICIFCFEVIEHSLFGKTSISLSLVSLSCTQSSRALGPDQQDRRRLSHLRVHLVFKSIRSKLARSRQAFPSLSRKAGATQNFARKITKSVTLGSLTSNLKVQGPK